MFTLREIGTEEAVQALCLTLKPENMKTCSPLLKHEIGFVFGQLGQAKAKSAISDLEAAVSNVEESPIVRHECVIALGDISEDKSFMQKYFEDPDQMVRESCIVASDMVDYWK
jgi:deoxyhypusine monooxygenase